MLHGGRTIPCSPSVQSISECPLPDVVRRFIGLGHYWQQDGFGSVLKESRPVLSLAFLDPVAVDLEGARVDELADGFDGVRVALDHLLGDRFGAAVVAVDAHCGENSHADDLWEEVGGLKEGNLQWKERTFDLHHWNMFHAETGLVVASGRFRILLQDAVAWIRCSPWTACTDWTAAPHPQHTGRRKSGWERP